MNVNTFLFISVCSFRYLGCPKFVGGDNVSSLRAAGGVARTKSRVAAFVMECGNT